MTKNLRPRHKGQNENIQCLRFEFICPISRRILKAYYIPWKLAYFCIVGMKTSHTEKTWLYQNANSEIQMIRALA